MYVCVCVGGGGGGAIFEGDEDGVPGCGAGCAVWGKDMGYVTKRITHRRLGSLTVCIPGTSWVSPSLSNMRVILPVCGYFEEAVWDRRST